MIKQTMKGDIDMTTQQQELPKPKQKLVDAWIEIHKDELMADWELAINGESVFKIDPLK